MSDDLDYMHARHCSPLTGRFTQLDPASESIDTKDPQSWNKYTYTLNNPLKYTDPNGESVIGFAVVIAIGGLLFGPSAANGPSFFSRDEQIPSSDLPLDVMAAEAALGPAFGIIGRAGSGLLGKAAAKGTAETLEAGGRLMPRSLGAASRTEMFARRFSLNPNSLPSRQILDNLDTKVVDFIGKFRKGSVKSEVPGEFLDKTLEEAFKEADSELRKKLRKLLIDGRFAKPSS